MASMMTIMIIFLGRDFLLFILANAFWVGVVPFQIFLGCCHNKKCRCGIGCHQKGRGKPNRPSSINISLHSHQGTIAELALANLVELLIKFFRTDELLQSHSQEPLDRDLYTTLYTNKNLLCVCVYSTVCDFGQFSNNITQNNTPSPKQADNQLLLLVNEIAVNRGEFQQDKQFGMQKVKRDL